MLLGEPDPAYYLYMGACYYYMGMFKETEDAATQVRRGAKDLDWDCNFISARTDFGVFCSVLSQLSPSTWRGGGSQRTCRANARP